MLNVDVAEYNSTLCAVCLFEAWISWYFLS